MLEGSDSLYVGDTSIFRIESEPQEVNLVDIDNKHAFGFTAGLLEGSDSQFVGIDDTGFTNTGILGLMTDNGVVDFFDDTDATGFTLNQFHKAPTLFVGATESTGGGTYENTGTLGTLGMVDFFNNTGAEGFTDMTDGVSEFKNIGDDNTFTKPDGITFDTHNIPHDVNNITFTNQTSNGLNFIDTDGVHSNGFTVGLTDTSDSQFVGVDETTPSFENTGNYYDSIHTRNPISDSIFGPVDFMSGVTSYYPTLESPIPGFTNDFGVGEESLPGYNAQAGALGISRFFRKADGSGEIQTGLENIYLGTGTHTMWGGSLTLADQIETGLSFLNKSSIFGDDPSTNDIEETDFALPYATGFTPGLSEIDYLNSQFEGVDEEAGTYTPRTSFQGGYVINTDNIDLSVDIPEDGELFNPAEDLGQFGTSNVGLGLFPSKTVRLQGGQEVEFTHKQFDILYGNDQTVKDAKFTGGAKMSLQNDGSGNHPSQGPGGINFGFSRGNEPYRILENGDTQYGDRIIPIKAMIDDGKRMANFIASDQGLAFMLKENFLSSGFGWPALQEFAGVGNYIAPKFYDPTSLVSGLQVGPVNVRTRRDEGLFGFLASLTNLGIFESIGEGYPGSMGQYFSKYDDPEAKDAENNPGHKHGEVFHKTYVTQNQQKSMKVNNLFGTENVVFNNALYNEYLNGVNTTQKTKDQLTFDPFTVMDTNVVSDDKGTSQKAPTDSAVTTNITNQLEVVEKQEHGMPLYFRDLRDGRIVTFRAYISGLNESLSPNWSEENYLGRSEPVYIYSGGAREIGFSLKLAAQSDIELTAIYEKLNRLTSMTYPEYKGVETRTVKIQDESGVETGETFVLDVGRIGEKQRMKAPMLKFRLGELYGSEGKEVLGFIKSLSYTFPDESPWETIKGKRVPKFVDVELGYQIIHDEVPSLSFAQFQENKEQNAFYGISLVGGAPFRKQADSAT